MKQKKSNLKLMLVVISGTVLVSSFFLLKGRNARHPTPPDNRMIMVANDNMSEGYVLQPSKIEWQEAPQGEIAKDAITKAQKDVIHDVEGAIVKASLRRGDMIKVSDLITTGNKSALSAVIHAGMRAVPVPFNKIANAPALISPGDVVDIILPKKMKEKGGDGSYIGQTILSGLRVLAVDKALQTSDVVNDSKGSQNASRTVTLEVNAEQAEDLGASIRDGQIILSMQSIFTQKGDTVKKKTTETKEEAPIVNKTVRVIRGAKSEEVMAKN
jgi:pilus assembly protein CpaB